MESLYERISKGTMSVDEITDSMRAATSEGGKFYQSMEKQSKTLNGQLSTLKDNASQLLGSMTQELSEGMAEQMLPMVNNIVAELQSALDNGGFEGLLDTATSMIPDLLGMMTGKFEDAISGLTRWLPNGIDQLMSAVPSMLSGATSTLPQITTALFGVASTVIRDLIGMLPELGPTLAKGILSVIGSIVGGIKDVVVGLFEGVDQMLHDGQKKIAGVWVSETQIKEIKGEIDYTPEVNIKSAEINTEQLDSLYEEIEKTLTDGLADTPEIIDALKKKVVDYYNAEIEAVGKWREEQLATIDPSLPVDEYNTAAAEINAQADAMIQGLQSSSDATVAFIDANAGKSTAACKEAITELDAIHAQAVDVYTKINGLTQDAQQSLIDSQRKLVAAGAVTDSNTMLTTLQATAQKQTDAIEQANETRSNALAQAAVDYADDTEAYAKAEQEANDAYVQSVQEANETYMQEMALLWAGIAKALSPEELEQLDTSKTQGAVAQKMQGIGEALYTALQDGLDYMDRDAVLEAINNAISVAEITDEDWKLLIEKLGLDPEEAQAQLADALADVFQGTAQTGSPLSGTNILQILGIGELVPDPAAFSPIIEKIGPLLSVALEEGFMDGIDGVDFSEPGKLIELLLTDFGDYAASEIGKEPIETDVQIDPQPTVEEGAGEKAVEAVEESVSKPGDTGDASHVTVPVKVDVDTSASDESAIEEAVTEQLKSQNMDVDVKANVSLDVSVSDSNGAEIGMAAGQEIGDNVAEGMESKKDTVSSAGKSLGKASTSKMGDRTGAKRAGNQTVDGLISALSSAASKAYAAGKNAGKEFARGYKETQEIHSPSRLMKRLGEYSGQGLEIGLRDSMKRAVMVAKQLSGEIVTAADMRSAMRVNLPNLQQEITLANQQSTTPVNIDGKKVAEIQGANNHYELAWIRTKNAKGFGY